MIEQFEDDGKTRLIEILEKYPNVRVDGMGDELYIDVLDGNDGLDIFPLINYETLEPYPFIYWRDNSTGEESVLKLSSSVDFENNSRTEHILRLAKAGIEIMKVYKSLASHEKDRIRSEYFQRVNDVQQSEEIEQASLSFMQETLDRINSLLEED